MVYGQDTLVEGEEATSEVPETEGVVNEEITVCHRAWNPSEYTRTELVCDGDTATAVTLASEEIYMLLPAYLQSSMKWL
jgi:hypothetical protein